jgi:hypothetical protein
MCDYLHGTTSSNRTRESLNLSINSQLKFQILTAESMKMTALSLCPSDVESMHLWNVGLHI